MIGIDVGAVPPTATERLKQRGRIGIALRARLDEIDGRGLVTLLRGQDLGVTHAAVLVLRLHEPQALRRGALTAQLHQATAQVGVATANMLPQLTLTGSYGGEATRFSNVFNPASEVWSAAASLTQPIFEGGKLLHQRRSAIAAAQEAAANYKATVLAAFADVANTLIALQSDADAFAASADAERAAAESLRLVQAQYKNGGVSYTQVLTSEQSYQTAAINLVKARAQRYADTAALFQALGGGWWNRTDVDSNHSFDCCKGS